MALHLLLVEDQRHVLQQFVYLSQPARKTCPSCCNTLPLWSFPENRACTVACRTCVARVALSVFHVGHVMSVCNAGWLCLLHLPPVLFKMIVTKVNPHRVLYCITAFHDSVQRRAETDRDIRGGHYTLLPSCVSQLALFGYGGRAQRLPTKPAPNIGLESMH